LADYATIDVVITVGLTIFYASSPSIFIVLCSSLYLTFHYSGTYLHNLLFRLYFNVSSCNKGQPLNETSMSHDCDYSGCRYLLTVVVHKLERHLRRAEALNWMSRSVLRVDSKLRTVTISWIFIYLLSLDPDSRYMNIHNIVIVRSRIPVRRFRVEHSAASDVVSQIF